jgi:hypothetical protein
MRVGGRLAARQLHALAGLLGVAVTVVCTACGSGSGDGKPSAATANPCLLVSQAAAQSILGTDLKKPQMQPGTGCMFGSGPGVVSVGISTGSTSGLSLPLGVVNQSTAQPGVGHGAECGPLAAD